MDLDNILHDPLTGAYSRAALQHRLAEEVERAVRHTQPLSLLVIDLDHFKSVNDAFGHARGDQVLREFVVQAQQIIRASDLLFRYGGDEFILLLPNTTTPQALALAERLLEAIGGYTFAGAPPIKLSLSIGCASMSEIVQTPESLFEHADRRLYAAKLQGRARAVSADPPRASSLDFDTSARLVERDSAIEKLREFLAELPARRRGLFRVGGPRWVGKSRMLSEVVRTARLQGYAVLAARCGPALRTRLYGALAEAQSPIANLPALAPNPDAVTHELRRRLDDEDQIGLLIVVDDIAEIDRATLDLFRWLLRSPELPIVALAYAEHTEGSRRTPLLEAPLQAEVVLEALSLAGVRVWLRGVLHWEAPESFAAQLRHEYDGLPGLMKQALLAMIGRGVLQAVEGTWRLAVEQIADLPLRQWLGQLAPRHNLPAAATSFVGREREIQDVKQRIDDEALVTIVGPGGIGKTRLALQAAAEIIDRFPDGVYLVPLVSTSLANLLAPTIAQTLQLALDGRTDPREQLLAHLANKSMLLILDNFEQLLTDSTPATSCGIGLLGAIQQRAPQVKLLVTSRERLKLPGEVIYELRGLPIPPASADSPATHGEPFSAIQLFVQSAQRYAPDFTLADDDQHSVRRICQLVDGMPLGIELAAAWTSLFTCRAIAEEIARSLDFLATTSSAIPERQRSVRAVLDSFWSLLGEDERRWVRGLAMFRGSFEWAAARQVAGASLFFLSALVDRAFLTKTDHGRYALHELLRQYAEEHLRAQPAELGEVRWRHATFYLSLATQAEAELQGPQQAAWLERLEVEHDNLRTALEWSLEGLQLEQPKAAAHTAESHLAPRQELGLRLAAALGRFWEMRGHWSTGRQWLEALLAARLRASERPPGAGARSTGYPQQLSIAKALCAAGRLAYVQGDSHAAETCYQEALEIGRGLADSRYIAEALDGLAGIAAYQGRYRAAQELFAEGLLRWRDIADQPRIAFSLYSLGWVALNQGDGRAAQAFFEECLQKQRELSDDSGIAGALLMLGEVARWQGDDARALDWYAQSLALYRELGNKGSMAWLLHNQGHVRMHQGDHATANALFGESLQIFLELGNRQGIAACLAAIAGVAAAQGRLGFAARLFGAVAALLDTIGAVLDPIDHNVYERDLAATRAGLGEPAFAAAQSAGQELGLERAIAEAFGTSMP